MPSNVIFYYRWHELVVLKCDLNYVIPGEGYTRWLAYSLAKTLLKIRNNSKRDASFSPLRKITESRSQASLNYRLKASSICSLV
jgi:hypothetical protein